MRLSFTWTLPETCTSRGGAAKCAGAWWVVAGNERMLGYLVSGQWHDKAGVWRWGWVKGQANKAKESVSRLPRRVPLRVVMTAHAAEQWTSLLVEGPNGQVYQAHIQPAAHLPATFTIKRGDEVFVDLGFTGFDNPDEGAGGAWSDVLMEAL
ncbi:MAG TPA: hypothetical protein DEH78_19105 [Solibacterales bacterium]|nr:hypothetical protein [Bryobacterales bacterium]